MTKNTFIIGGGYTGISAALHLTKAGHKVTIIESDSCLGGLAGTFEATPKIRLEKFYHHWFSSDTAVLDLITELGLGEKILRRNSNTGLYFANSIFRLASPIDLLKFHPIPFLDRIRTGLMALYARKINEWMPLEKITAVDWIKKVAGEKSYKVIWGPLLKGKFGVEAENVSAVWFWNKLKLRGSSRGKNGKEELIYFDGGFGSLTDSIAEALKARGVTIKYSETVNSIETVTENNIKIKTNSTEYQADNVLVTIPLPIALNLIKNLPSALTTTANQIRFLGNVCLVLRLKKSLSSTYWLNVADPTFPFVGVIEHTNLDDKSKYDGQHIAYVSKYLPITDELFSLTDDQYFEYAYPFLKKIFPDFSKDWIIGHHVWRASYSQPVVTLNYSKLIPPAKMPIGNIWMSNMAQIYPEDRGTNYAVRAGKDIAEEMVRYLK